MDTVLFISLLAEFKIHVTIASLTKEQLLGFATGHKTEDSSTTEAKSVDDNEIIKEED